ncbi:MAG: dihydropteroate synthase [Saprospiraceae bacterium]
MYPNWQAGSGSIKSKQRLLTFEEPMIMGILNLTDDSFVASSRIATAELALIKAREMFASGARVIDIGAASSRPGAQILDSTLELKKLLPAISLIRSELPDCWISVDTFRSDVAKLAIEAGADIINDISGGDIDDTMFELISDLQVPYICMHMRGNPTTMQNLNSYKNLRAEVFQSLQRKIQILASMGIEDVIIDPGIGFAKNSNQNFELLEQTQYFQHLGKPLLLGISRKSFIYKSIGKSAEDALIGTSALHWNAIMQGVSMLRVHDVEAAVDIVKLWQAMKSANKLLDDQSNRTF